MKKSLKKSLVIALAVLFVFGAAACSKEEKKSIKLAYVAWDSEIASTNVVKHVLETDLGYEVELLQVDAGPMWAGVADGSADAMVAAWLPGTHASYLEQYGDRIEDLGPNLTGTKIGLAVPTYMDISSIEDLKDPDVAASIGGQIVGIEPGAGIMMATERAIEEYGLDNIQLLESSSSAMGKELLEAYEEQRPIVVTGWTPHWKFAKMELKYLDDPLGVYGGEEAIHTMVRQGLADDMPDAYEFLDRFEWTADDMAAVMVEIYEGASPEEAAQKWVESNRDKVDAWLGK
ncbi:Proline/glycine betaine ABC superfamily ATP binding cassette transporter, membrane protein [Thermobacillus xylanilyticus]|jgi:glycine betaine/proline transport system substrate-binding protein|uniref:Proline/glycine betaine ABC superfamily ATP binding cassette transporter, membrane protein n=1 Tax=Thermobacillus xylanilyticus TaxID=76633 RepID=A0ABM8V367_THEXY|nr:glycine betaine ABC transporter substrate-binding protein [Thermobacillus xylanilyticus]REJ12994.1 MAG: glycine/betaine ABC transporter [Paenibacillaceae bacterium]CAG5084642.1 Proline/glycine betaine ABC superfamily ATP binding cassette transporter, membrane protein [Thermobacillus xylanilyticus]